MKRLRGSVVTAGAISLALHAWQDDAAAAGFATQQFGGEHGTVVETNPTSLYYNPGGLGFSSNSAIGGYGSLALHSVTWKHDKAPDDLPDPPGAAGAGTGEAKLLNVFGGASIAGTTHIGNFVIGGGFFAPFYGLSHWGKNDAFAHNSKFPLPYDGIQRWFGIDGKIEVIYFTVGVGYRFGPLSVGVTGNFISSTLSLYQAKSVNGPPNAATNQEGRSYFDVQGFSGSFGAGAMLEIVPDQAWLALSYQSQPGLGPQSIDGDAKVTLPPSNSTSHFNVTLHQSLPDVYRAGVRVRPKSIPWEFRAFGDFTRWSVFTNQCVAENNASCDTAADGSPVSTTTVLLANVRRNWTDTWGVRLGASYWAKPRVELFLGAGYEIAAVPDSTLAPDIPDANNILGAIGGRFQLTDALFFLASYTHIQYLNRDNTGKSTLATDSSGNPVAYPTAEGNGGGKYTQWAGVLSGNLEAIF